MLAYYGGFQHSIVTASSRYPIHVLSWRPRLEVVGDLKLGFGADVLCPPVDRFSLQSVQICFSLVSDRVLIRNRAWWEVRFTLFQSIAAFSSRASFNAASLSLGPRKEYAVYSGFHCHFP